MTLHATRPARQQIVIKIVYYGSQSAREPAIRRTQYFLLCNAGPRQVVLPGEFISSQLQNMLILIAHRPWSLEWMFCLHQSICVVHGPLLRKFRLWVDYCAYQMTLISHCCTHTFQSPVTAPDEASSRQIPFCSRLGESNTSCCCRLSSLCLSQKHIWSCARVVDHAAP